MERHGFSWAWMVAALLGVSCSFTPLAVAEKPALSPSGTTEKDSSRVFFALESETHFTLTMTEAEWKAMADDMLSLKAIDGRMRTGNLRKASFSYRGSAGDVELAEVGIRTRGNMSRQLPEEGIKLNQAHFQLNFSEPFDLAPSDPAYAPRKDRRFLGMSTLALKCAYGNGNNDTGYDKSLIREVFSYRFLNSVGVNVGRATVGTLTFQLTDAKGTPTRRLYYGPYTVVETINKAFLKSRFGGKDNDGNLYKCLWQNAGPALLTDPGASGWAQAAVLGIEDWRTGLHPTYDLNSNKDSPDHRVLKEFVFHLNTKTGTALQAYLEDHFEVDRLLRALAGGLLVGNPDDYWAMGNNYYLYFHNKTGKGEFIPYDYDHSLGGGWMPFDTAAADPLTWANLTAQYGSGRDHPLVDRVLALSEYRNRYKAYLKAFATEAGGFNLAAFTRDHQAVANRLRRPKASNPADTWLTGIAVSNTGVVRSVTPSIEPYLVDYFAKKATAVASLR